MRYVKILFSFVVWLFVAFNVAHTLQVNFEVSPVVSVGSLLVLTLMFANGQLMQMTGCTPMFGLRSDFATGVDVNIWAREIIKRWRKDNAFLKYAVNEAKYVIGGAAVLIPQPGAKPNVVKNRSDFPGVAIRRSDTTVLYALDEYSTDPTHITFNELQTISYDKMNDIITDNFLVLIETMSDDMLVKWLTDMTAANIIYTTGDPTAALEGGQAGSRLACTLNELQRAQGIMNKANVEKTGRIALFEENMYQQFIDSLKATPYRDAIKEFDTASGLVGRLFGFDIMTRSTVVTAAGALDSGLLAVNAIDAAIGADDDVCCVCWQQGVVANATGTIKFFADKDNPLYYGDILSVSARAGGRVRRADALGIIAIKQAKVAVV